MKTSITLHKDTLTPLLPQLVEASMEFTVDPRPFDFYKILVKEEHLRRLVEIAGDTKTWTVVLYDAKDGDNTYHHVLAVSPKDAERAAVVEYIDNHIDESRHDDYLKQEHVFAVMVFPGHLRNELTT